MKWVESTKNANYRQLFKMCANYKFAYYNRHNRSPMRIKLEISIKFGERVRALRTQKGLSQEQLAHEANLHRTYIGMIERAEKNITISNIDKIAKALDVNISELFN